MADLELFAVVLGVSSPSDSMFPVKTSGSISVGEFKELVHAKLGGELTGTAAFRLVLWKLNTAIHTDQVNEQVAAFGQDPSAVAEKMNPAHKLSRCFGSAPPEESLHIIVQLPSRESPVPSAGQKRARSPGDDTEQPYKRLQIDHKEAFDIARRKPPPSNAATSAGLLLAQAKDPILNGRPSRAVGPPVTIYEPVFSMFRAMNEGKTPIEVSVEDYESVIAFLKASSEIYQKERDRQAAITKPLIRILRTIISVVTLDDGTSNDGVVLKDFGGAACLLMIREIKNEVGSGNGDPSVQASFSYPKWWASPLGDHFRDRTCCPSLLLSIAGPWICVHGGILAGKSWTVQPLTDFVWAGTTTDMDGQVGRIARLLCSLKVALDALERQFEAVKDMAPPLLPPSFPSTTSYLDGVTQTVETITYTERLHCYEGRETTAIFSAILGSRHRVFIKFVTRYNAAAHRLLAKEGYAPQLRHCSELVDGATHFMVVMDQIDGDDMYEATFTEEDLDRVRVAKDLLHTNGYVFGDLRSNNVFKPANGQGVMLVDFDWCGKADVGRYPLVINQDPRCNWHPDVKAGAIMRKSHDDHLFNRLRL